KWLQLGCNDVGISTEPVEELRRLISITLLLGTFASFIGNPNGTPAQAACFAIHTALIPPVFAVCWKYIREYTRAQKDARLIPTYSINDKDLINTPGRVNSEASSPALQNISSNSNNDHKIGHNWRRERHTMIDMPDLPPRYSSLSTVLPPRYSSLTQ
ncbi:hypothetical protein PMAYCL1PPCAC_10002, partial [Pristionchus mayeri]